MMILLYFWNHLIIFYPISVTFDNNVTPGRFKVQMKLNAPKTAFYRDAPHLLSPTAPSAFQFLEFAHKVSLAFSSALSYIF